MSEQDTTTTRRPMMHRYLCANPRCANWLTCHQLPDQCAVPDPYLCPSCEFEQYDAFMDSVQFAPALRAEGVQS